MQVQIVRIERGETSNSRSPMWRCQTVKGAKVNIFNHADPNKDSFHFFADAGYGDHLLAMKMGEIATWRANPILVSVRENGPWLEIEGCAPMPTGAAPDAPPTAPRADKQKIAVQCWAAALMAAHFTEIVVWDTETTGLGDDAEIVEISAREPWTSMALDTLVKPSHFNEDAAALTGITYEMVKDMPSFPAIYEILVEALEGKVWVIWNASFDAGVLERECQRHGLMPILPLATVDAMDMFARWWGEWDAKRQRYTSKSLSFAAEALGLHFPAAHRADLDVRMTLKIIQTLSDMGCE